MDPSWRVYIDEAGDRGISPSASDYFTIAAVIVPEANQGALLDEHDALHKALGRQPEHVLHFQKMSHSNRVKAAQDLGLSSAAAVTAVIMCKREFADDGQDTKIKNADPMYLYAIRMLLERISWYVRDHGGGTVVVTFGHIRRFKAEKLHDYRRALEYSDTNIHWPSFVGHPFRINTPEKVKLLQLADIAASSIFQAIEPDRHGNAERKYLNQIAPKLYRRKGNLVSYGLKTFPARMTDVGGDLAWFQEL